MMNILQKPVFCRIFFKILFVIYFWKEYLILRKRNM